MIKIAILGGILGFTLLVVSFKMIKNKITTKDMYYEVEIILQNKKVKIQAILDTGNFLTDPITTMPVIIVEMKKLEEILPERLLKNIEKGCVDTAVDAMQEELKTRCSIIPFSSLGMPKGILIGFRPDNIQIRMPEGEIMKRKAMIGIYPYSLSPKGSYHALIGLQVLDRKENMYANYSIAKN